MLLYGCLIDGWASSAAMQRWVVEAASAFPADLTLNSFQWFRNASSRPSVTTAISKAFSIFRSKYPL